MLPVRASGPRRGRVCKDALVPGAERTVGECGPGRLRSGNNKAGDLMPRTPGKLGPAATASYLEGRRLSGDKPREGVEPGLTSTRSTLAWPLRTSVSSINGAVTRSREPLRKKG